RVAVGIALRIEPRAGIAVPVPGPAHAGARFEHMGLEPELAQAMELVEPRDARPDDDRVVLHGFKIPSLARGGQGGGKPQDRYAVSDGAHVMPSPVKAPSEARAGEGGAQRRIGGCRP